MKRIISVIICFVFAFCLVSCASKNYIEISKVKEIVAQDVGADVDEIDFDAHNLVEDGNDSEYYDVKFSYDGTEYEYKVDAMSGNIIEKDSELKDTDDNSVTTTTEGIIESFVDDIIGDETTTSTNIQTTVNTTTL